MATAHRIAHVSDLHFGREDPDVAEALLEDIVEAGATLVAVSGDLTQRAFRRQFEAAGEWLQRLAAPWIAVPGNHDVPVYDLVGRFFSPLVHYREYVSEELDPLWVHDGLAVLGLNTARSLTVKQGRLSLEQIASLRSRLTAIPDRTFTVVVTHHPFLPPSDAPRTPLVGRATQALEMMEEVGVDLLLTGHLHRGFTGDVREFHTRGKRSILVAQAGTAISTRRRGEPNAYNLVDIEGDRVTVRTRHWNGDGFSRFRREDWVRGSGKEWKLHGRAP